MLRPQLHPFDSGKVASRVGYILLGEDEAISDGDVRDLIEAAAADHFDLIWIQARTPLDSSLLDYRGTIVALEGDRDEVLSRTQVTTWRYDVQLLASETGWAEVEHILRFAAPTRFSTDPQISLASLRQHKLTMLRNHIGEKQGVIALARTLEDPARLAGYHCTSLGDDSIHLYEIAVDPEFRGGFAAVNLVRYNLERFSLAHPDAKRVTTRIYEDNIASLRFFERLGLRPTGLRHHYYHFWGNQHR